jgi:hypothetical protein
MTKAAMVPRPARFVVRVFISSRSFLVLVEQLSQI